MAHMNNFRFHPLPLGITLPSWIEIRPGDNDSVLFPLGPIDPNFGPFKNISLYVMSNLSFKRYYFVLRDRYLFQKFQKWKSVFFYEQTLHRYVYYITLMIFRQEANLCSVSYCNDVL